MCAQPRAGDGGTVSMLDALLRRRPPEGRGGGSHTAGWHELVLASTHEGILAIDADERVAFANPAAVQMLARTAEDIVGAPFGDLIEVREPGGCPLAAAAATGDVVRAELFFRCGESESFPAEVTATPVRESDEIVGVVVLFRDASELKRLGEYEVELVQASEREAFQRAMVEQLQAAVMPPRPSVPDTDLGVYFLPADPAQPTGGDLYDWQVLTDGDLHLSVVDVIGKGVTATKHALAVVHALRILALDGCPVEDMVARTHELLSAHNPDLVATLLVARYRPSTGHLRVAGASHPPLLRVAPDGTVTEVPAPGIAVGWPGAGSIGAVELDLDRRETVVLYTDGLVEATRNVLRGLDELKRAAKATVRYPARHLPRVLVERSLSGAERRDDTLALVLRRRTPVVSESNVPAGAFEYRFSPQPVSVPLVRAFFSVWLNSQPLDLSERDDLLLVASELATNAIRASSGADGSCCLRAWAEDDALVVEAEDDGPGIQQLPSADEQPPLDARSGRGLFIVQGLVHDLRIERAGDHTKVRAIARGVLARHLAPAMTQGSASEGEDTT